MIIGMFALSTALFILTGIFFIVAGMLEERKASVAFLFVVIATVFAIGQDFAEREVGIEIFCKTHVELEKTEACAPYIGEKKDHD